MLHSAASTAYPWRNIIIIAKRRTGVKYSFFTHANIAERMKGYRRPTRTRTHDKSSQKRCTFRVVTVDYEGGRRG
jgi:hypothetical protein